MEIRYATLADADTIARFNQAMALETENKVLADEVINAGVGALMENPRDGFYVVAVVDGVLAASLMVTSEWSDWRNGFFWWIQSVYVEREYRRRGLYSAMYRFVKNEAAQRADVCGFRLYVEQENISAQNTYEYLGMKRTAYVLYEEGI
ncbi:MAG: Acetyltransferase, GNAT family [Olavius algarvensis Delta 4 endosymbiont]|nr:MAG: Acetyltransferase, GNAT family [Olavius algarvensis Delta 4 endosymbiont]